MDKDNPVYFTPDSKDITKKYTNGEVTIVWKPSKCVHSTVCWKELPEVFDTQKRPWITPEGATTEKIIAQVRKCPSQALSYFMNETAGREPVSGEEKTTEPEGKQTARVTVQAMDEGPLIIFGDIIVKDKDGTETVRKNATSFCRCGLSKEIPYCDGAHLTREKKSGSSGIFRIFK